MRCQHRSSGRRWIAITLGLALAACSNAARPPAAPTTSQAGADDSGTASSTDAAGSSSEDAGARDAQADHARVARMKADFAAWAKKNGVEGGALAIVEHERIVGSLGIGAVAPSDPQPIASNSKAITAICVLKLVEAGRLHFEDTLGSSLPSYFMDHPPADAAALDITLAALLTHTSGIASDPTQGSSLLQFEPFSRSAAAALLSAALAEPLAATDYAYNNVNYAALEVVIETVTGDVYATYCNRSVLLPAGITDASINPDWAVLGAFGGWRLSAEDDARFLAYFDPNAGLLKTPPSDWPQASVGSGAFYSLGAIMRPAGSGYNFWHFGSWTWTGEPEASFGAYFARWSNDYGVAANYHPTVDDAAMRDLDQIMLDAAR